MEISSLSNMRILIALLIFVVMMTPALTIAQEGSGKTSDKGYEELLRRIEVLERRLQDSETKREALADEVNRLKADKPAKAETQVMKPKAAAAQAAIQPETPESVSGITSGWDKGPYIKSGDGMFEFRPAGILHLDFRGHDMTGMIIRSLPLQAVKEKAFLCQETTLLTRYWQGYS